MPRDTCGARTLDPAEPARPAGAHEPRLVLSFATETVLTNLPDVGFHRQTNKCWDTCVYEVSGLRRKMLTLGINISCRYLV